MSNSVKKIVILGRDADAWMSARVLAASMPRERAIEVHLIELPSRLTPNDCYAVLPSHKALMKKIGLDESALIKCAGAQYVLAQRFVNWSHPDSNYFIPYDTSGINLGDLDFFQAWVKAKKQGMQVPLEQFSLGAMAAQKGKYLSLSEAAEEFSVATYGFHLQAVGYLNVVARQAMQLGVIYHKNNLAEISVVDGRIQSLQLDNGEVLCADFFIDASGVEARLISSLESPDNWQSWRPWLKANRVLTASLPAMPSPSAFSQIVAQPGGWLGIYPMLKSTALRAVYDCETTRREQMLSSMGTMTKTQLTNIVEKPLHLGLRKESWIGNCVALGDAAMQTDPVDATDLHFLGLGISTLCNLFPNDCRDMPEANWFNKKMQEDAERVRDFQIAHYQLNGLKDDPFWEIARKEQPPEALQQKLRLFESRGKISLLEAETFQEESWISLFVGQDLIPKSYDPRIDVVSSAEIGSKFQQMLDFIAGELESMPSIEAHVEMNSDTFSFGSNF